MAPSKRADEPQWPPRSPREALLGTPGGRERYRNMANRTSPSPSPLKKARTPSALSSKSTNVLAGLGREAEEDAAEDEEDDEDDEETLQLKLQELQARLKLKKLQSAKAKEHGTSSPAAAAAAAAAPVSQPLRPGSAALPSQRPAHETSARSMSQNSIEIPASPVRKARPEPPPQTSPSRVLLGIDKGRTAKDISLKRAPSLRRNPDSQSGLHGNREKQHQFGGYLQRSNTPSSGVGEGRGQTTTAPTRPLSFNERLAASRAQESERHEKHERAQRTRSKAFGIGQQEIEELKLKAVELPEKREVPRQFRRDEVMAGQNKPAATLQRTNTVPGLKTTDIQLDVLGQDLAESNSKETLPPEEVSETEASAFEPYSGLHLKKRIVPHGLLTRHLTGKKIMTVKEMLREVKSPDFELPDYEQDIVFFAIVAKRSEPRAHQPRKDKNGVQQPERGKYMVITLVDLEWELELFLFNTGFDRFWKISEGTVIAILNPGIMPPPPGRQDAGRFSLVVNSDEDKVIEVGMSRDLGFCQSVKKDGHVCSSWVNGKRTQFCDFHTNEALDKKRAARMEVNTMDFGRKKSGSRGERFKTEKEKKNNNYDRETHSHWFASRSLSSAELIDGAGRLADKREKEEGLKRRLVAMERERGIMDRLGKIGSGTGREYMKKTDIQQQQQQQQQQRPTASGSSSFGGGGGGNGNSSNFTSRTPASPDDGPPKLDARALELLQPRDKSREIHLGPVKRKRPESAQSSSTLGRTTTGSLSSSGANSKSATGGFGWGGNLKDKLSRMREGEKLQPSDGNVEGATVAATTVAPENSNSGDRPPVRKKTRFITSKGIREAGRESLGDVLPASTSRIGRGMVTLGDGDGNYDDDDDDDLVILK